MDGPLRHMVFLDSSYRMVAVDPTAAVVDTGLFEDGQCLRRCRFQAFVRGVP